VFMSELKKKAFSLRIDPVLFEQYEAQAIAEFRSMNSHFESVLTAAMDDLVENKRKLAHERAREICNKKRGNIYE